MTYSFQRILFDSCSALIIKHSYEEHARAYHKSLDMTTTLPVKIEYYYSGTTRNDCDIKIEFVAFVINGRVKVTIPAD